MRWIVLFFFVGLFWGQSAVVLVDDAPMCGHHDRTTYNALWDSLAAAGAVCHYTTDLGRYPPLDDYDLVLLMHHFGCEYSDFSYEQAGAIIDYVCNGGNIIVMPIVHDDLVPTNRLLSDPRWETGLYYGRSMGSVITRNISSFSPYTDGLEYLLFEISANIEASPPAWPFAWDESGIQIVAAISYPESDSFPCDCDYGGRILALPDNHTFEAPVVGYVEPMAHRFIMNALIAMSGMGRELPPCDRPPGIPYAVVDTCLYPGDTYRIDGVNLHDSIIVRIGAVTVAVEAVAGDSSWMEITIPHLPQGVYTVRIEDGRMSVVIGELVMFCDWLEIHSVASGCYEVGDTVYLVGQNFPASDVYIELISPDDTDTIVTTDLEILSDTLCWFIMPAVDTIYFVYHKVEIVNAVLGNRGRSIVQIPCPCPGMGDFYRVVDGKPTPADTRDPIVRLLPADSCALLSGTGLNIYYETEADSFMAHPSFWPERERLNPISFYVESDPAAGFTALARDVANTGEFGWMPPRIGDYPIAITATDYFGNIGADTLVFCIDEYDVPPLSGHIRPWEHCEPDSFIFTLRRRENIDTLTLVVEFNGRRIRYPEGSYWLDDTTLVFKMPDYEYSDSTWYSVHVSSMLSTVDGIRIIPDDDGLRTIFPIDRTPPEISFIYPEGEIFYDSLPSEIILRITDWLGVDEASIWASIDGDTAFAGDSGIDFADSILTIDLAHFTTADSVISLCVGASDIDYPEICVSSAVECRTFTLIGQGFVQYLAPSDTIITSCELIPIQFLINSLTPPAMATLEMEITHIGTITYPDSRLSFSGDTIIFTPDTAWQSCEIIEASLVHLEDEHGLTLDSLPSSGRFMIDTEPPLIVLRSPPGMTDTAHPIIEIAITDNCTGIGELYLDIDGSIFNEGDAGFSFSSDILLFDYHAAGLSLEEHDTNAICVHAHDLAMVCGVNSDSLCFSIFRRDILCDLELDIEIRESPICVGDTAWVEVHISGGYGEIEIGFNPPLAEHSEGLYYAIPESDLIIIATAIDDSGCVAIDTAFVAVHPIPVVIAADTVVCAGDVFSVFIEGTFDSILWSNGDTGYEMSDMADFDERVYWVAVYAHGCMGSDSFTVATVKCDTFPCTMELTIAMSDTTICLGDSVMASAMVENPAGSFTFEWSPRWLFANPDDTESYFLPQETGYIVGLAIDDSGCVALDSTLITVITCPDIVECLAYPKPFTPNDDGINDEAIFEYPDMEHSAGRVYIYTLDNKLVRTLGHSNSDAQGRIYWDGRNTQGRLMENGAYLFVIMAKKEVICHGTVYLMR